MGRLARTTIVAVSLLIVLLGPASIAAAQDPSDPYGGTTTTTATDPGPRPSCTLRTSAAAPGSTATVRVEAAPRGTTIEVRFDGASVASETATGPGSSPRVDVDIDFTVPSDASPGEHTVIAVGADFSAACGTANSGGVEVLGAEQSQGGGDGGGSALPHTGVYVAVLVAVGLALLVAGRALLEAGRRRRRREAHAPRRHLASSGSSSRRPAV